MTPCCNAGLGHGAGQALRRVRQAEKRMAQGDLTKLEGRLHTTVTSARRHSRPGRYGRTEWPCVMGLVEDTREDHPQAEAVFQIDGVRKNLAFLDSKTSPVSR